MRRLQQEQANGKILVARTSRLLQYNVTQQYIRYNTTPLPNGNAVIDITEIADPVLGYHVPSLDEVRGVTFYTSNPKRTGAEIAGHRVGPKLVQDNPRDGQHASVTIRWYPPDRLDHSRG